jgi:hypothetical protein
VATYDDPRRAFLADQPQKRQSTVANDFLHAKRQHGAKSPVEVLAYARQAAVNRGHSPWNTPEEKAYWQGLARGLKGEQRAAALAFAAWCLEYEALDPEAKRRLKAGRGEQYRIRWMAAQPATDAQVRYLRALGHTGAVESKAAASELIDGLLAAGRQRRALP